MSSITSNHPNLIFFTFCSLTSIQFIIAAILPTISLFFLARKRKISAFFNVGFNLGLKTLISSLIIGGTQYFDFLYNLKGNFTNLFISRF